MADLEVDIPALAGLARDLRMIVDHLEREHDLARDYGEDDLGHRIVVDAVRDFADEWNDNRDKLVSQLDKLKSGAEESADKFSEADRDLAASLVAGS